eukprot:TRINITY_DN1518_c0_g1::TRINITY_DN1518_c0_g1_i2::g.28319::m.28319 TRINITY_DN1518_c0_g1::TRINITY_DN1518_c0_g1_i2::g.28319  ORF type:complete len:197 (-),score=7.88 TRINITY_DN1518_c0_g1_i2:290-880(-)
MMSFQALTELRDSRNWDDDLNRMHELQAKKQEPLLDPFVVWSKSGRQYLNNGTLSTKTVFLGSSSAGSSFLSTILSSSRIDLGSYVLPENSMKGMSLTGSPADRVCLLSSGLGKVEDAVFVLLQYKVPESRVYTWVKGLLQSIKFQRVIILDALLDSSYFSSMEFELPCVRMLQTTVILTPFIHLTILTVPLFFLV